MTPGAPVLVQSVPAFGRNARQAIDEGALGNVEDPGDLMNAFLPGHVRLNNIAALLLRESILLMSVLSKTADSCENVSNSLKENDKQ